MPSDWLKRHANLKNLTFAFSLVLFVWVIWYCYTGFGGAQELVSRLLPIALILQILFMYQKESLYKWLPAIVNHVLVAIYIGICVYAFVYFLYQYEDIAIWRQGSYTTQDFVVGLLMFLLVMELSRLAHPTLFWVNFVLVLYTLFGYLSPLDFFWHPGTSFYRVVTSSTVEMSNGIYGIYGQIALTLIAAFLLLGRHRERVRGAERDDPRHAADRRQLAANGAAGGGARVAVDRHGERQRLGQCGRGRQHHHSADEALRRAGSLRRRGGDRGFDGRPDHAAHDGGGRVPDVGVPRRAVLGRGGPRVRSRVRLLRVACLCRLSPLRAPAAARTDRGAQGVGLQPDQDLDFLPRSRCFSW